MAVSLSSPQTIRCFVAAAISKLEIVTLLSRPGLELKRFGGVKWVPPDQFHYTLKFLGEIPRERVGAAKAALIEASLGGTPFFLSLEGLGCFPPAGAPRIVWAGAGAGKEKLQELAQRVEKCFEDQGFPREPRAFSPHLTLGRVKEPARTRGLQEAMISLPQNFGIEHIAELILFQSQLKPEGPVYTTLARERLQNR